MATNDLSPEVLRAHAEHALRVADLSGSAAKVGTVIAQGEEVVATGYKGEIAELHAEQVALDKVAATGIDLSSCVIFTTLEPCANSRTSRVSCAERIAKAKIATIYIGVYDRNPQVYRLGWKHLNESGMTVKDFPSDLRARAETLVQPFAKHFTSGAGQTGGAKFDFTQNGGRFTIRRDEEDQTAAWETRWTNCGADAIYANGGRAGVVAHARFATQFVQIDDPGALDYGDSSAEIPVGGIAVFRGDGFVLCRVEAIDRRNFLLHDKPPGKKRGCPPKIEQHCRPRISVASADSLCSHRKPGASRPRKISGSRVDAVLVRRSRGKSARVILPSQHRIVTHREALITDEFVLFLSANLDDQLVIDNGP